MEALEGLRPVEPEIEPELPANGLTNLQRLREAHQFGNFAGLYSMPVVAVIASICSCIHQGSFEDAFSAFVGGALLGYFVGYIPGMIVGYVRVKPAE